jgi:alpha-beta hydrolase superfamily lysophospholipase
VSATPAGAVASPEVAGFFPVGPQRLFGVLARPREPSSGTAVVVASGGGHHTSAHINRLGPRLSRLVAASGHLGVRFDYHGVGESTGDVTEYRLAEPFTEDLQGAIAWARHEGARDVVVVGLCFGARTALAAARTDPGVRGLVLVSLPLLDLRQGEGTAARRAEQAGFLGYLRAGLRPDVLRRFLPPYSFRKQARVAWAHLRVGVRTVAARTGSRVRGRPASSVSVGLLDDLRAMVARRIPILLVYGGADPFLRQFRDAAEGPLAPLLEQAGDLIEVLSIPDEARAYESVAGQERLLEAVGSWLVGLDEERRSRPAPAARS